MKIIGLLDPATPERYYSDDCAIPEEPVPVRRAGKIVGWTTRVWVREGSLWAEMELEEQETPFLKWQINGLETRAKGDLDD